MHDRQGIARAIVVHSQGQGMDYATLLDVLRNGQGRYRGVVVLTPQTSLDDIAALNAAGVCGARFNFMPHLKGQLSVEDIRAVVKLIRPYGWHAAFHVTGAGVVTLSELIRSLDVPVVIDHMARPDITEGPDGPVGRELRRLLDTGRVWVKVSGADRLSKTGAPFHDVLPFAQRLVQHAPERMLWGTDWPHVNLSGPMPDDGDLVDLLMALAPKERVRRQILVENPTAFFGFDPPAML